ncbi:MAG: phosphoserine phosphatase SerB [Paraglaciecola sp.]|nr:phosphoserine phosphatase SerB [Paraglaciecola sp.]NCT48038.1 phosphoserine phosphatase SerB [Paraglaciecola sp.]
MSHIACLATSYGSWIYHDPLGTLPHKCYKGSSVVFERVLRPAQLASSLFLQSLVEQDQIKQFVLKNAILLSLEPSEDAQQTEHNARYFASEAQHHNLLVRAEGLCLEQIQKLSTALNAYLKVAYWQIVKVAGLAGFALNAKVMLKANPEKSVLEKLATQFSLDVCLFQQKPKLSEPGLLVMDMDSTVIAVECIDEIAALAGVGDQVAAVTAQAMLGKLDFAKSLRTRVACLANADERILANVRAALPLMPGITQLVRVLKQHQWKCAIASGGFTYFADYLQERLELDAAVANVLDIKDGKLSGSVVGDIVDAKVKAQTLSNLAKQWSIPPEQTVAMGDGANDLAMMQVAALGVALHAKPVVREQADISIRRGGLDSLLYVLAVKA